MSEHDFPSGRGVDDVLEAMRARRGEDYDWRGGRTFSLVYHPDDPELERLQEAVALEYLHENALNPFAFPGLTAMEAEVVAAGAGLVHSPPRAGKMSSGGTESIFLAVQTARDAHRAAGGSGPRLVTADTVHPAFAKAAGYLDVEHVKVPVRDDGRADVPAMAGEVDERTALLVGSAPNYPFGVIDPVEDLAAVAAEQGVLLHVDACLGGWLLPFWEELGEALPRWDFRVDGVTSLSMDVHKYGWSFKGASLILYRDEELMKRQYFLYDDWPGGLYGSGTTAGTRAAAPIAAAWATLHHLGREGYLDKADQVREATRRFREGIEATDGVHLTHPPDMSVMQFSSDTHDIGAIGDAMDDRGWHLDRQQAGLHLMLWPYHLRVVDRFLEDLAAAVAGHGESRGVEARYGGIV